MLHTFLISLYEEYKYKVNVMSCVCLNMMPKRHTENMEVNVNGFVILALMERGEAKVTLPMLRAMLRTGFVSPDI
jgi:hypothetical protein